MSQIEKNCKNWLIHILSPKKTKQLEEDIVRINAEIESLEVLAEELMEYVNGKYTRVDKKNPDVARQDDIPKKIG